MEGRPLLSRFRVKVLDVVGAVPGAGVGLVLVGAGAVPEVGVGLVVVIVGVLVRLWSRSIGSVVCAPTACGSSGAWATSTASGGLPSQGRSSPLQLAIGRCSM